MRGGSYCQSFGGTFNAHSKPKSLWGTPPSTPALFRLLRKNSIAAFGVISGFATNVILTVTCYDGLQNKVDALTMGAGRKTSTYDYDTKAASQAAAYNFEAVSDVSRRSGDAKFPTSQLYMIPVLLQKQRNLGESLGGCIFGEHKDRHCGDDQSVSKV